MYQVSDYPWGTWDGCWPTLEALEANDPEVANFLDGGSGPWYVKYPDGQIERRSFEGISMGFVGKEEIRRMQDENFARSIHAKAERSRLAQVANPRRPR